ncbi:MAG: hypothetical protein ACXWRZ_11640 [Bdellovibrio sp.]
MIIKTLATLILISSIVPIKSYGSGLTVLPTMTIAAPTELLFSKEVGLSKVLEWCYGRWEFVIFGTALCGVRDVAEIKMNAENVVFSSPISDAAKMRLINFVAEIKEKIPATHDLSDDAVILELAKSQLIKK